jgi:transcription elongation factor SPT6
MKIRNKFWKISSFSPGISHKRVTSQEVNDAAHFQPTKNDLTGMWECRICHKSDFPDLSDVWNHLDDDTKETVCRGKPVGVRLRLDNGISGFIPIKELSDNEVVDPEKRVRPGQVIQCRIANIKAQNFSVTCSSKSSVLIDEKEEHK